MATVAPAKAVSRQSYPVAGKLLVTEHVFEVPKDYSRLEAGVLRIFGRSVRKVDSTASSLRKTSSALPQLPWLAYLQGGPGLPCRPPQDNAWTQRALEAGYQIFFMDPRGTGLSTPLTASTLQMRGYNDVQAQHLKLYRADSIVRDLEAIRQTLTIGLPEHERKWSTLGQSFGGFCTVTYLSFFPNGLRECFLTGGLMPLVHSPDEVYRRLYAKVRDRNEAYYAKFPTDVAHVRTIMNFLKRFGDGKIKLPSEGSLTRRRFRQLGLMLGAHGGLDQIHDIVLRAAFDIESFGHLTRGALSAIDQALGFDENLIYSILHEQIYCAGAAPNWSAHRILSEFPEFDIDRSGPIYFTGEMIFPWMFEDYSELSKVQDVANRLAADADWPLLFDEAQLARNEVPVYAASYLEDMYVDSAFALETARKIKGCKVFTTNVMYHNALRSKATEVMDQLFALRDDVVD